MPSVKPELPYPLLEKLTITTLACVVATDIFDKNKGGNTPKTKWLFESKCKVVLTVKDCFNFIGLGFQGFHPRLQNKDNSITKMTGYFILRYCLQNLKLSVEKSGDGFEPYL